MGGNVEDGVLDIHSNAYIFLTNMIRTTLNKGVVGRKSLMHVRYRVWHHESKYGNFAHEISVAIHVLNMGETYSGLGLFMKLHVSC